MNMPAQGTDAWMRQRAGKITASVVGKIVTGSGKDEVLRDMVRESLGYPRAFTGNVATEYGTANEDQARIEYALETGVAVRETGFHVHPEHDWLGASPDGLVGQHGLLEVKCPYKLRDADAVPDDLLDLDDKHLYWHQMQCQMAVMDRSWCDLAMWSPGDMRVRRFERDPEWLGIALGHCLPFLAYLKDVLADPDEAERIADMTRDMSDDGEWESLAGRYREIDAEIKALAASQGEIKKRMVEMAGERKASGFGVTVSPVTRSGGVDYKAMAKAAGVDPEQYRKPATTSWTIRVSKETEQ